MRAVAAPADRRFRRAHVKPGRRRRRWRAFIRPLLLSGALGLLLAYGMYRASSVAAHAHVLQVERIVVRGNERLSRGEVLAVLNGLRGESLVWTDLDRWRRRLLAAPWVRDAALGARCRQPSKSSYPNASQSGSGASTVTCTWSTNVA